MIYLASPYTKLSPMDKSLMIIWLLEFVAEFNNRIYYSPILYSHQMVGIYTYEQWIEHGLTILKSCERMTVYCYNGWSDSDGVEKEIKLAMSLDISVDFVHPTSDKEKRRLFYLKNHKPNTNVK